LFQASSEFQRWILVVFSLGVVSLLIWWLRGIKDLRLTQAIGLIIGGAVGNVIDRIAYGKVADFFHLHAFGYSWYVFNVADTAIVFGVILMAVDLLLVEWRGRSRGATEDHT
jgi:signal peptidase II